MFETPQFVTGPWSNREKPVFLEDREYGLALDALVKGCSDVLVVSADGQRVLLGRRKVEPQPDWWYIGGRVRPGDTTTAGASRNVRRELGLEFPEERFEVVANYSLVWAYRLQAPQDNGTADISTIHALYLTEEEEKNGVRSLDPDEYAESKWWNIDEVISQTVRFHPCLISSLKSLKARQALHALEKATDDGSGNDADSIAEKALEFVKAVQNAKATQKSTRVIFDEKNCKYIEQK
uniref:Nudix hydrolase domain-containing protein n=1 Tax=Minutocellus polymorphus TaxID=265543 RepID=A0A6U0IU65_9STRA|mmetsp:Transcript_14169/g.23614  ORF Transcript_14169/g.23614 Transcript_14169/m.23614 type:complete len:237 (+) Transcript_14169:101-811(+)